MTDPRPRRREAPRGERILPGLWRLRLPLPWQATPHGNAYAVAADGGIVLFDTGIGGAKGLARLEQALAQAGWGLEDVRLVVCTHTHADHYGCAASIVAQTGCPLWLHPAWDHIRDFAEHPERVLERRLASGRRHGLPAELLERIAADRRDAELGVDGAVPPDRELVAGVEVETDLGRWTVHETPGHAPSHVVFHQPERRLLLSGDMLVGQVFLYFDTGHTPDPVGEFLASLDRVEGLDAGLCVSGHGRPFREIPAKAAAFRTEVDAQLGRVREALGPEPASAFELIRGFAGHAALDPGTAGYLLEVTLAYLTHLEALGEAHRNGEPEAVLWSI